VKNNGWPDYESIITNVWFERLRVSPYVIANLYGRNPGLVLHIVVAIKNVGVWFSRLNSIEISCICLQLGL